MSESVKDIRKWMVESNCFEVMGQLRKLGVLTRADLEKAMQMSRSEWIDFMLEKTGLAPETNSEKGGSCFEKEEQSENV